MLPGRRSECKTLDDLLECARAGRSKALVVRGEPGIGKTALLEYAGERASESGCRVTRAAGVQCEMDLAFAGLHQVCAPVLDRLEHLPGPQRDALGTAFAVSAGNPSDRFLVSMAALSLLTEVAEEQPLVCLVDDAQWLDRASAQVLAFVARRLSRESVALVFAVRRPSEELADLPELPVEGLHDADARTLLDSVIQGPLDERVRDRIVAEARGNPSALLELPRGFSPTDLAGGFGLPDARPLSGRTQESLRRRLEALPAESRRLLLVAAADSIGEPVLVWRAAECLGIGFDAAAPATAAGLCEFGTRVRFHDPLVRSAVYRAASPEERRSVHRALAEATDPQVDPDRCAWHRAQAARGPDEDVAQARGGRPAAAAFLKRATELTPEPARRGERALAAAQATYEAGDPDAALGLLAAAQAGPLDELQHARVDVLRAQIAALSRGSDASRLLLEAAKRLEPLDVELARETYLDALSAALSAGPPARDGGLLQAAQAARAAPPSPQAPRAPDLLLDGLAVLITEGCAAGTPLMKRALSAFRDDDISGAEGIRWLGLACHTAMDLWDDETWHVLSTRFVELVRDAGALAVLPIALSSRVGILQLEGELATAAALIAERDEVRMATGSHLAPYEDASGAAGCGLPEQIEEAVQSGNTGRAAAALLQLAGPARASGTDWALGIEARSRALLKQGEAAERLYREAIDRLARTRARVELARSHLLYGEWLRREHRRVDAREELRTAHEMLTSMGIEALAQRAARQLLASGGTAQKRAETSRPLTAREGQIARLARDGLSNVEIGARLFLSPRTVEYHLTKIFAKLGVRSRIQLESALADGKIHVVAA